MRLWIFAAVALAYLALASHQLHSPGIFQDEAAFVPVSLNIVTIFNSDHSFLGWLLFEVDYVGALKAWLNTPFYHLFGVSVETIRLPPILAFTATLFFSGIYLKRLFGLAVALLFVLLLGLNPNIIAFTRADFVPFALSIPIKIALFSLLWNRLRSWKHLGAAAVLLALGMFHRLDFLWSIAGFLGAFSGLELYRSKAHKSERNRYFAKLLFLAIFTLCFWWLLPEPISVSHFSFHSLGSRLENMVRLLNWNLEGSSFLRWHLKLYSLEEQNFILKLGAVLLFWPLGIFPKNRGRLFEVTLFAGIYVSLTFLCVLAVPRAGSPHHLFALEPFWELGVAAGLVQIYSIVKTRKILAQAIAASLAVFWLSIYAANFRAYLEAYSGKLGPTNPFWSEKIYELAKLHSKNTETLLLGWGAYGPLAALSNDFEHVQGIYSDPLPEIVQAKARAEAGARILQVVVPDYYRELSSATNNQPMVEFEKLLQTGTIHAEKSQQIEEKGKPFFTIFRLHKVLAFQTLHCENKELQIDFALSKNGIQGTVGKEWSLFVPTKSKTWAEHNPNITAHLSEDGSTIVRNNNLDRIPGLELGEVLEISHLNGENPSLSILLEKKNGATLLKQNLLCVRRVLRGERPF